GVLAQGARRDVPPGSTSEVLPGERPALARPLALGRALALTVDGPQAWILVDDEGRAVGAPRGGTWLGYLPAVRGPLQRARGVGLVAPDAHGAYQVVLWGEGGDGSYRVAAWGADGQVALGGSMPAEAASAVRTEGQLAAGQILVVPLTVR